MSEQKKQLIQINVVDIIRLVVKDKSRFVIWLVVFGIIGLVFAFTEPKKYKSSVMLAPEESGTGFSGSLSSLASMVGMDMKMGMSGDAIYPELYPDLMSSTDFIVDLFPINIKTKDGKVKCNYSDYLQKYKKIGLADYPMAAIIALKEKLSSDKNVVKPGHKTNPFWLTKAEDDILKEISHNISCSVDKKTSVITITVEDQDPYVAATMADSVCSHLQEAITMYRTQKARNDLKFMQKLFEEAHQQYVKARQLYAAYADANQDVILQSYKMKEDDLENEMQLKYNIYQQVAEQRQLALAKVQERTPAFTVVQKASVPLKKSNKSKIVVLAMWLAVGFVVRTLLLMWRNRQLFIKI